MKKFLITVVLFSTVFFFLSFYYKEGSMPVNNRDKITEIFVIKPGENATQIAKNLEKEGLIRNRLVFYIVIKRLGIDKKIQAGDFRLSPSMNAYQIGESLTKGTLDIWVTIIEGLRKEEIAQIFGRELNIPESEFLKYVQEGYLFPDTYLIPKEASAGAVVAILTKNFNKKYSRDLKNQAKRKDLTDEEVIILASLVEREARFNEDRPLVASVILNRLKKGMKLDIDATVQYALGYQSYLKSWWKKDLTREDLEINSPYNTYKNPGLPPTAICNPGLAAIKAVIEAPQTNYFYYISDKNGKMHYAKTLEEHNENIRRYLR
jgi:UPF0755 protein